TNSCQAVCSGVAAIAVGKAQATCADALVGDVAAITPDASNAAATGSARRCMSFSCRRGVGWWSGVAPGLEIRHRRADRHNALFDTAMQCPPRKTMQIEKPWQVMLYAAKCARNIKLYGDNSHYYTGAARSRAFNSNCPSRQTGAVPTPELGGKFAHSDLRD